MTPFRIYRAGSGPQKNGERAGGSRITTVNSGVAWGGLLTLFLGSIFPFQARTSAATPVISIAGPTTIKAVFGPKTPPRLETPHRDADGTVRFFVTGDPVRTYVVEVSSDLKEWNPLVTVAPFQGSSQVEDDTHVDERPRYYRVKATD